MQLGFTLTYVKRQVRNASVFLAVLKQTMLYIKSYLFLVNSLNDAFPMDLLEGRPPGDAIDTGI